MNIAADHDVTFMVSDAGLKRGDLIPGNYVCTICGGIAKFDLPRTCPGRQMIPFESMSVYTRKLEYQNRAWAWNPTVDWELHGEPPSVMPN